jgi:transposase-like protein
MTGVYCLVLFRDLWKKYATSEKGLSADPFDGFLNPGLDATTAPLQSPSFNPADPIVQPHATPLLTQQFLHQAEALGNDEAVKENLRNLKQWVDEPKEPAPDLRFFHIKNHLKTPEVYETLRQERWQPMIHCPQCQSYNISRLVQMPPEPPENYRYRCLDCCCEFNDDSGTPLEDPGPPTIQTWIECWYLWGCTDSLNYIAHRLRLDINTVERMLNLLQKLFQAEKPLSRLDESPKLDEQSRKLKERFKLEIQKTYERLNTQLANVPTDTLQHRHQETIRRHGRLDPDLEHKPTVKPSSGKK